MLKLKDIKKHYTIGNNVTKALDGISASFRKKEFVAILGTSGSGKTTCLNIIGGLDTYDSGDLIINGKSTKNFKEEDWDAYRNNTIGFVFQSYNLIPHIDIVENVELGMTLSGVGKSEKRKRALDALKKVGLEDHIHKKPNQLSGGQMQRVAIARALSNDPDILLCDEPTGALDTDTSIQIMNLIKKVASDKLVIMVTHNPDLAHEYADRIVEFKDGKIISDSNPSDEENLDDSFTIKKTKMSFLTALKLSFNNLKTKKGRTALTAFASSIGIIGIALILSLSGGFQIQIDKFQTDSLSNFPIMVTQTTTDLDMEEMMKQSKEVRGKMMGTYVSDEEYPKVDVVYPYNPAEEIKIHTNKFTDDYLKYIEKADSTLLSSVGYTRTTGLNLVKEEDGKYKSLSSQGLNMTAYPKNINHSKEKKTYIEENYDLLAGKYPTRKEETVLVVSTKNRIDKNILKGLKLDKDKKELKYEDIIGTKFKSIKNNDYYTKTDLGIYTVNPHMEKAYESKESLELEITGIVRQKEDVSIAILTEGIAYSDELSIDFIEDAKNSQIVKEQKQSDYNILTGEKFENEDQNISSSPKMDGPNPGEMVSMMGGGKQNKLTKSQVLAMLGENAVPSLITIYPTNFEAKDQLLEYLNEWNNGKSEADSIYYTDMAATMTELTGGIMNAITMVLVAFAGISLVVSLIMISIITYTSVLERTKEIGILKALGARKKDITRVFDAETTILGIFSGVLGILIAFILIFPINKVIYEATALENVAQLKVTYALGLIFLSTVLTLIGGHIPALMAARKDAVEALRSE